MRILLAGGSGVLGSRLVPALVAGGHDVVATTRRHDTLPRLRDLGAAGVIMDAYDAPLVRRVTAEAAPDVVVHQLTDLGSGDRDANARLRREGTANLVAAAEAVGVERMMVQSIAWSYVPGDSPADEDTPLEPGSAVEAMEDLVCRLPHATVLRYGMLYGPDTWYAPGALMAQTAAAGLLPATPAITSFVHVDDAIAATVQAIDWPDGAYNIVDDEPAAATEWLPVYAAGLGAPAPQVAELPDRTPLGRGATNAKARAAGWTPAHPSWREGFPHEGAAA